MEYIKYVLFGFDLYHYRNGIVSPWTFYREYNERQRWLNAAQDRANEDSLRSHYAFERSQRAFELKLKQQRRDRYGI